MKPHWLTEEEIDCLGEADWHSGELGSPVYRFISGWYYWDEVWAHCFGPFETREECQNSLTEYAKTI